MMDYYGYGLGFGLLDFVWHLLLLVAIIWFLVWLVRGGCPRRWHLYERWEAHSALSILNERYAKGEIDYKEYEERKKALMN